MPVVHQLTGPRFEYRRADSDTSCIRACLRPQEQVRRALSGPTSACLCIAATLRTVRLMRTANTDLLDHSSRS